MTTELLEPIISVIGEEINKWDLTAPRDAGAFKIFILSGEALGLKSRAWGCAHCKLTERLNDARRLYLQHVI